MMYPLHPPAVPKRNKLLMIHYICSSLRKISQFCSLILPNLNQTTTLKPKYCTYRTTIVLSPLWNKTGWTSHALVNKRQPVTVVLFIVSKEMTVKSGMRNWNKATLWTENSDITKERWWAVKGGIFWRANLHPSEPPFNKWPYAGASQLFIW